MSSSFIHLHTHSHFSLLHALPKIKNLVGAAKDAGMPGLALTDNGNLYGAIEFYKECQKQGIKPVIGLDAYLSVRTRHDKEAGVDNRRTRLVLLAENETGYKNLLKLSTKGFLEGFYYKPRLDRELLETHAGGLIAIIPSYSSEVAEALRAGDDKKASEIVAWYKKTFGGDNVFLEITHHPELDGHGDVQTRIKALAQETGTPPVASQEVYYLNPEDRIARETMIKIQSGGELTEYELSGEDAADFSFFDQKTAEKYFSDTPEAIANTHKILERCNVTLELGSWVFPDFTIPAGTTYDEVLRDRTYAGLEMRGIKRTKKAEERIEYELDIIKTKGFSPYFLVVADLLNFAREHNILSTTRGSAAGSLVSYLNGITNVDPLEYELPFERFLNPERPKAPDIDMDFADDRRDEVIQYAKEKYGDDKVAQIGTFGTMMARGVVRDVARALGYPYTTGDRIAKLIPFGSQGFPMTIDTALETVPEFADLYKKEREVREVVDLGKKIEGCARHISVHAAGVVIAPSELTDWIPLQFDPKGEKGEGKLITQYNMHAVEDAGLLKFDFLGIRNLAILADAVTRVKKNYDIDIDIENIPVDDKKTFDMLARGETMGLFQLNGSGMTRYLKELKPSTIHDINAMVALYRPGPMESIPSYIERKHSPHLVSYLDPRLEDILYMSHGVITYQDDVLLIAVNLAGFSWLEADALRKAMGKKIPAEMAAQREKLIHGFIANGMSKAKAEQLWKLIEPFAAYGFNKAHAASYGKVAYQTAYMKANFPVEYMAAHLTADSGNVEKVAEGITECARMGIPVLPPDINESVGTFTVVFEKNDPKAIRFGLYSIKNFGEGIAGAIIGEREENGAFKSLGDFLTRVQDKNLNRKSLEALIKAGALDAFGDRPAMLASIDTLLEFSREQASHSAAQDSLFGGLPGAETTEPPLTDPETQITKAEMLSWEKELLGLYVSGHPLDAHKDKLARRKYDIHQMKNDVPEGIETLVVGIVETAKPILTKSGDRMLFATIRDYTDAIEIVVFPRIYSEYKDLLEPEHCVACKGRLSGRNGETSFIVESIKQL